MVYFARNPLGYKNLLTWSQADRIYIRTIELTKTLHPIKDSRLIDQMVSSARSGKRNIEEGFKRATTAEYIKFLGFAIASLAELRGDYEECERLRQFPPTDCTELLTLLRGEDVMLGRQIMSLERKMDADGTRPAGEKWQAVRRRENDYNKFILDSIRASGCVRLPNGQVVKKEDVKPGEEKG